MTTNHDNVRKFERRGRREHQHQHDRRRSDESGELRLGAGLLGDCGARPARTDRESLEETGGDIRDTNPDHLAVAVDLLSGAGSKS